MITAVIIATSITRSTQKITATTIAVVVSLVPSFIPPIHYRKENMYLMNCRLHISVIRNSV